jgi:hypothetical protein
MRKLLMVSAAVASLGLAAPLMAEDATAPKPVEPAATSPATTGATTIASATTSTETKFIGQQAAGQLLATNLIGMTVYGPADENLGNVNDIILAANGSPDALVIGVGGFLGIGERNVAVSFSAVTPNTDADGNVKLVLNTTKEELNTAPSLTTLAMLKQQRDMDAATQQPAVPSPGPAAPANPSG